MIDYVFADEINGVIDLVFDETEVIIDGLLEYSTFGLDSMVQLVLFDKILNLILSHEDGWTDVIVVFFDTGFAASQFFAGAAVGSAEDSYFIAVFAFIHHLLYQRIQTLITTNTINNLPQHP